MNTVVTGTENTDSAGLAATRLQTMAEESGAEILTSACLAVLDRVMALCCVTILSRAERAEPVRKWCDGNKTYSLNVIKCCSNSVRGLSICMVFCSPQIRLQYGL